jgi:excinuclease ABC subunit C
LAASAGDTFWSGGLGLIQLAELKKQIILAPDSPGVYLMRDQDGRVIYVGKAKSLKKRLLNYFGSNLETKTQALMAKVAQIEYRLAPSEAMALLLEYKLIHDFNPHYNISLKDDKSFPWVRISGEAFPSLQMVRKKTDAKARYLGPYTSANLLKSALKIIRREFAYRSCLRLPKQSCVYYRINLCPAPCIGKIDTLEYRRLIDSIILILEGKGELLVGKLSGLMQAKSRMQDFEAAASIRDQISVLSQFSGSPQDSGPKNELEALRKALGLKNLPSRIEGFDLSNLSGTLAVGSMVSFYQGAPDKNNYRRFKIKSFSGIDDYKMLAEVVRRRYTRLLQEKKSLPDLLLIDGGRGHILTAARQLAGLNLRIPLVSIAKEKENIYKFDISDKISRVALEEGSALNLIRRIRDEAHRFALAYHHLLRKKALVTR